MYLQIWWMWFGSGPEQQLCFMFSCCWRNSDLRMFGSDLWNLLFHFLFPRPPPSFHTPITAALDYFNSLLNGVQSLFPLICLIYCLSATANINRLKTHSQIIPVPVQSLPSAYCAQSPARRGIQTSAPSKLNCGWLRIHGLCSSQTEHSLCTTHPPGSPSLWNLPDMKYP